MAETIITMPFGANEVECAHTPASFAFRSILRTGLQAIRAERDLTRPGPALPLESRVLRFFAADDCWEELDHALDAVLTAPTRRASDVALKRLAMTWKVGLTNKDAAAQSELAAQIRRDHTLFQINTACRSDGVVNALLSEARPLLHIFFTLDRFLVYDYETAESQDAAPEPDDDWMPCA